MARCASCKVWMLGGVSDGEHRYCTDRCRQTGILLKAAAAMPDDVVYAAAATLHAGPCPRCKGPGPVDLHVSSRVMSALVASTWRSTQHVVCRSCARTYQITDTLLTLLCGWWSIPHGIIMTP